MQDRLFIGDNELELSPSTVIALTLQINDLSDLKDRQANLSNQFKVPKTKTNAIILESCELVTSTSAIPYQKSLAKVVKDGIELYGVAIIQNTNEFYNIVFYSGLFDFFSLIDGRKMSGLNLSAYDHVFGFTEINSTRANTSGYKYPIIDYGALTNVAADGLQIKNLRPAMFVHTLIDKIFSEVGVNKSGAVFSDSRYLSFLLPFTRNYKYNPDALHFGSALLFRTGTTVINPNPNLYIEANGDGNDDWHFEVSGSYTVNSVSGAGNAFSLKLAYATTVFSDELSPSAIYLHPVSAGTGSFNFNLSSDHWGGSPSFNLFKASFMFHRGAAASVNVDITSATWYGINNRTGEKFKIKIDPFSWSSGGQQWYLGATDYYFFMSDTMPDMTQTDFLKGIFNSVFAAIYKSDSFKQELIFSTFKEISDNRAIAKDWSDKLHNDDKAQIDYHATSYAQKNYMRYKVDGNDKDLIPETYDSFFTIADQTLQAEKNVIDSPFAATKMEKMLGGYDVPLIRKIDNGVFSIDAEPRLLIDDTRSIGAYVVLYKNGSTLLTAISTDVPFCYFFVSGKTFNLDYASIKAAFFTELINSLQNYKKVTPQFLLKEVDINELDHFIPVYVSKYNQYFYLNKIMNWKQPEPTKTEIIKL